MWVADPTGPALVLGSAQPESDVRAGVDIEVVRRRSGGGAVLVVPGERAVGRRDRARPATRSGTTTSAAPRTGSARCGRPPWPSSGSAAEVHKGPLVPVAVVGRGVLRRPRSRRGHRRRSARSWASPSAAPGRGPVPVRRPRPLGPAALLDAARHRRAASRPRGGGHRRRRPPRRPPRRLPPPPPDSAAPAPTGVAAAGRAARVGTRWSGVCGDRGHAGRGRTAGPWRRVAATVDTAARVASSHGHLVGVAHVVGGSG